MMSNLAINVPKRANGQTGISIKMQNFICSSAKIQNRKDSIPIDVVIIKYLRSRLPSS